MLATERLVPSTRDPYPHDKDVLSFLQQQGITSVLYPGRGEDASLDATFPIVVGFDNNPKPGTKTLALDVNNAPQHFRGVQFDALYLSAVHFSAAEFQKLLSLVRSGGMVIYNYGRKDQKKLGGVYKNYLDKDQNLKPLPNPFTKSLVYLYHRI